MIKLTDDNETRLKIEKLLDDMILNLAQVKKRGKDKDEPDKPDKIRKETFYNIMRVLKSKDKLTELKVKWVIKDHEYKFNKGEKEYIYFTDKRREKEKPFKNIFEGDPRFNKKDLI